MVFYRCHQMFLMVYADHLGPPIPTAAHSGTYPVFL